MQCDKKEFQSRIHKISGQVSALEQMYLDKKSFFIGMMYPRVTKNLEDNNIHIRIKSDSWGDHENEKIHSMLNELYEKHV